VSANNRVSWEAAVRVDIPTWPDWEKVFSLVVWPGAGSEGKKLEEAPGESKESGEPVSLGTPLMVEPEAPKPPQPSGAPTTKPPLQQEEPEDTIPTGTQDAALATWLGPDESDEALEAEAPGVLDDAQEEVGFSHADGPSEAQDPPEADGLPEPSQLEPPEESSFDPSDAIQAILAEDALGGGRGPMIKALVGQAVSFDLVVDRVERTFGRFSDSGYQNGRTGTGTIGETGLGVSVWYPEARNAEVDAFERGSSYPVQGTVEDWDSLRKRPNVRAREERG